MPLQAAELKRGRIVLALFPFASAFPVRLADGSGIDTIDELMAARRGAPTSLGVDARVRPVLLLHNRTRGPYGDVICLRINTVKPPMRRGGSWSRIERHEHPFFFHLSSDVRRYGLREDSVIALSSLGAIHKSAIAGPRSIGELTTPEMQAISERLARLLSLDLAPFIAAKAQELLRRLGQQGKA